MTLFELFCLCDNLGHNSHFTILNLSGEVVNAGTYEEMYSKYGGYKIMGFAINEQHARVYMKGV